MQRNMHIVSVFLFYAQHISTKIIMFRTLNWIFSSVVSKQTYFVNDSGGKTLSPLHTNMYL
jgi:hypothetical protein